MKEKHSALDFFLDLMIEEKLYSNKKKLRSHLNYIFEDFDFSGKDILDVGGGAGLLSFYGGFCGGSSICLEPELEGSSSDSSNKFDRLRAKVIEFSGKVEFQGTSFQDFQEQRKFDLIVMANSINHLNEKATIDLLEKEESRQIYSQLFRKVHRLLKDGGTLIITDCNRYNFFDLIGLRSPFMPTIEWSKHQSPYTWTKLLREVGFKTRSLKWTTPNALGVIGRILFSNPFVAYFLLSHFRIKFVK